MPTKIGYQVVGNSGEAEGHDAKYLERHGPTVPGWQTPRFCIYPQELILRLSDSAKIKKLQILSHQYMIPSKVEFFVGTNESISSFKRLGYIYLSNNEKTGFKSRELKSVHVAAEGQYVRIVIHKNHLNKFNVYNQVGIMAINVIGDTFTNYKENRVMDSYLNGSGTKPDYISPMDDLAFDMYQDPEVAEIIRRLDERKKKAVQDENFDLAKRMKQAIADLQKVGEKLARYELEKRRAVEHEDYDLAKSKKAQMEEYRLKVYQQLRKHNLLLDAGVSPVKLEGASPLKQVVDASVSPMKGRTPVPDNDVYSPIPKQSTSPSLLLEHSRSIIDDDVVLNLPSPTPSDAPLASQRSEISIDRGGSRTLPKQVVTSQNYDDKVVPTLNKDKQPDAFIEDLASPRAAFSDGEGEAPAAGPGQGEPEAMSERHMREAASVIDVFGLPLVSGAYSKTWSFREDTLLAVYKLLQQLPVDTSKEDLRTNVKAALFLINRSVKDKVHAVFSASLKLLEYLLNDFIPKHKLGKAETSRACTQILPNLIQKTGETAARSRTTALDFIDQMSSFPLVHQLQIVPQQASVPFKKETSNRLALSRAELMERLVQKFGLEPPSLTVDTVMKFAVRGLEHASGPVREASTRIIFLAYKLAGISIKSYLPSDDPKTRKNPLYRNIFDGFDRIDGKPTRAELKAQMQEQAALAEQRKKEEIMQLQQQVNELRAMNDANQAASSPNPPPAAKSKKKSKNNAPAPNAAPQQDVQPEDIIPEGPEKEGTDQSFDKMCIFCGERDDAFTEAGLDLHYWKHCPMLKRCEYCKQVVEIAGYIEHLLNECDHSEDFGKCPRCTEAIPKTDLQKHIADKKCAALKGPDVERCPLCHADIPANEAAWKSHLMGVRKDACQKNPRRIQSVNRIQTKENSDVAAKPK